MDSTMKLEEAAPSSGKVQTRNGHWPLVIGLSGVSSGGKTRMAEALVRQYSRRCIHILQDSYFYPEGHPRLPRVPELNHYNFDVLDALNMQQMTLDVQEAIRTKRREGEPSLIVVDGFTIFGHEPLLPLLDLKYFFTLPKDEARRRRLLRVYDPPDPDGYFDLIVWPMHKKHLQEIQKKGGITFLDGLDFESQALKVKADIEAELRSRSQEKKSICVHIEQDKYYWPVDSPRRVKISETPFTNVDTVRAVHMSRLLKDVCRLIVKGNEDVDIVLLDGTLIFNYRRLVPLIDLKYYLLIPKEIVRERRVGRTNRLPDTGPYFDKVLWPMFKQNLAWVRANVPNVVFLDGMMYPQVLERVIGDIEVEVTRIRWGREYGSMGADELAEAIRILLESSGSPKNNSPEQSHASTSRRGGENFGDEEEISHRRPETNVADDKEEISKENERNFAEAKERISERLERNLAEDKEGILQRRKGNFADGKEEISQGAEKKFAEGKEENFANDDNSEDVRPENQQLKETATISSDQRSGSNEQNFQKDLTDSGQQEEHAISTAAQQDGE
ncbi:unnamed protein product [Cyprideis torosa]|uniref:Uncharacterized protein n=1 Tax=Cyprideis torosa TaxID=163714 RepID=A0A7R8W5T6_9CRUS|nr:unnamed protein product [Cyprideis torosa]CAG0885648.1 unnamed protein product [Cyprideis torosa]